MISLRPVSRRVRSLYNIYLVNEIIRVDLLAVLELWMDEPKFS